MNKYRSLTIACALILPALFTTACDKAPGSSADPKAPPAVAIELSAAKRLPLQRTIEIVGTLCGDEEATISAKVTGQVTKTFVDIGDRVEPNQPLAQVDPSDYELARQQAEMTLLQTLARLGLSAMPSADFDINSVPTVQQAKLQAANAKARFHRSEKLYTQQPPLISEQDYADSKTAYEVAKSAYDVALLSAKSTLAEARTRQADLKLQEQRLADSTVRAPRSAAPDGKLRYGIASREISVGEYVKEGNPMFRVIADNPIRLRTSIPERYLADVQLNQLTTISVDAYPDSFQGTVKRINPQVDPASRAFQVEIHFDNPKGLLHAGSFAHGAIAIRTDPNVLFVPQESVVSFAGIRKVFTVQDNKAVEHQVTTGAKSGKYIEIVSGLKQTTDVVTAGAARLANGMSVQLQPTTRPAGQDAL